MKKIIGLFFALSVSVAANASEIKILDVSAQQNTKATASFKINSELGRAWVEVETRAAIPTRTTSRFATVQRVLVPGLSFDKSTNSVTIDVEGRTVECASLTGKVLHQTGLCSLTAEIGSVLHDDGFEVRMAKRLQVILSVE